MKGNDFLEEPIYERAMLVRPGLDGASTRKALQAALEAIKLVPSAQFDDSHIGNSLYAIASELGIDSKPLLAAMCVAITGNADCTNLFGTMATLGKERVTSCIEKAIGQLMVIAYVTDDGR